MEDAVFIRVAAAPGGVREAGAVLDSFFAAHGVGVDDGWRVRVSLDEALSNVVRHGAAGGGATVGLGFSLQGETIEVTIADRGPAFNPLHASAPDLSSPLETRPAGGVGITLVRALMDEVHYQRRNNENVLTLRKRLTPRSPQRS